MSRPLIAVTTSTRSGWRVFPLMRLNLWLAGARAVRWGTDRKADLSSVEGVIIGGGDDISPDYYGGKLGISARLDPRRDEFERRLAEQALSSSIPVLGICRGAQMLNVALGGTLDQTAWETYSGQSPIKTILPKRNVEIAAESHLARYVGTKTVRVNSLHTQAVDALGRGLRVAARDAEGMIQAIERVRDPFALGVQWHPEHLFYRREHRRVFEALVHAACAYAKENGQLSAVKRNA